MGMEFQGIFLTGAHRGRILDHFFQWGGVPTGSVTQGCSIKSSLLYLVWITYQISDRMTLLMKFSDVNNVVFFQSDRQISNSACGFQVPTVLKDRDRMTFFFTFLI